MTSREVTNESMITWRTDDPSNVSVVDTSIHGRLKFMSPTSHLGNRSVVTRSPNLSPLAVSFGDFNPWSGDWSEVVGASDRLRQLAAPTSAYWCTAQSVKATHFTSLKEYLLLYREIVSHKSKIDAGVIHGNSVGVGNEITLARLFSETEVRWDNVYDTSAANTDIGPWLPMPVLMEAILDCLVNPGDNVYFQGDRARVKVSASPFGGDTHGQLNKVHTTLQSESTSSTNSPMGLHNYTEITSLPILGSTTITDVAGGLGVADNIHAWDHVPFTTYDETSPVDDLAIAAPDVALDQFEDPNGGININSLYCFPLFVNQAVTPTSGLCTISFYQPHLTVGGDGYSAKILMAAGGTSNANGFMSSGMINDMSITSAGLQIGLPDTSVEHQFWIDGTKLGHRGSYGIPDGDRPWHSALVTIEPSIANHYLSSKTEGDGNFSISQFGYAYNNYPIVDSDWPIVTFHFNPKLKSCICQAYSLANAVFHTGTEIGIELASFTQPFTSFQWEDVGGKGSTSKTSIDLKGYRYKYENADLSVPKGARVDSRKADGGHKMATITSIPLVREKVKMWTTNLHSNGVSTTTGRFDAISANDTGMVETVGGPLFTVRPQISSNIYIAYTASKATDVIGRSTLKVI